MSEGSPARYYEGKMPLWSDLEDVGSGLDKKLKWAIRQRNRLSQLEGKCECCDSRLPFINEHCDTLDAPRTFVRAIQVLQHPELDRMIRSLDPNPRSPSELCALLDSLPPIVELFAGALKRHGGDLANWPQIQSRAFDKTPSEYPLEHEPVPSKFLSWFKCSRKTLSRYGKQNAISGPDLGALIRRGTSRSC